MSSYLAATGGCLYTGWWRCYRLHRALRNLLHRAVPGQHRYRPQARERPGFLDGAEKGSLLLVIELPFDPRQQQRDGLLVPLLLDGSR